MTQPTTSIRIHTVPAGSTEAAYKPIETDLIDIIQETCPNEDGLSILYTLSGSLRLRAASLAAKMTNVMASHVRLGDTAHPAIDKFNDAIAALKQVESREWAFHMAGLSQPDMMNTLKDLICFGKTVDTRLEQVSKKPVKRDWASSIEFAATPREVEGWKLTSSWEKYKEQCEENGEEPLMTEEVHNNLTKAELAGKKQPWSEYRDQILDTINMAGTDGHCDFLDIDPELQKSILESISSKERKNKLDMNALKFAQGPADYDTKLRFIKSFISACRLALTHQRYTRPCIDDADAPPMMVTAQRSSDRRKLTAQAEALANADAFEYTPD